MSVMIYEAGHAPIRRELFAPSQETAKQQSKAACKQPLALGENTPHGVFSAVPSP